MQINVCRFCHFESDYAVCSDSSPLQIESYFHLIVSDEDYAKQVWSLGNAYVSQKKMGNADSLIGSIVIFQSRGTREVTLRKFPDAVFLEYLDGAGYFSSLNGDLRKMLAKPTTKDFIQIRTAPIKLRRVLQEIQFLTPLEIEHAVIRTSGNEKEIVQLLKDEGYGDEEISRAFSISINNGDIIAFGEHHYSLNPKRIEIVRKYCILDIIANCGEPISVGNEAGCLFVAGFEPSWGLPQNIVIKKAQEIFPELNKLWPDVQTAFDDIQWLISKGFIITK